MSHYELLIRGGSIVTPEGVVRADLAVGDGVVVAIDLEIAGGGKVEIDATGLYLFPGAIDAHVHFNEPGRTAWEGFASGTRALAAGGATSYFDMPLNAHPPTLDAASFDLKHAAAQASSLIDYALWGGLTPDNLDCLDELAERGVIGFKAFMSNSGIDDFRAVDDDILGAGMQRAAQLGRIVAVHAEDEKTTSQLAAQALAAGRTGIRDYLNSRPVVAELDAIRRAIGLAEQSGCALHVVHVSSGRGVSMVAEARARGVDISCETCPHYLVLTENDMEQLGAIAKCAPPLRPQAEQDSLWKQLFDGSLPIVASDHSPAPASMKTDPNFFKVWGGIAGGQSTLGLLLSEGYVRRGLPLPIIAAVVAERVSRRFGLAPHKGQLAIGSDADLALVDLGVHQELRCDELHDRHRQSPYVGRMMQGRVVRTILRGTTICHENKIVSTPIGKLLRPGLQAGKT